MKGKRRSYPHLLDERRRPPCSQYGRTPREGSLYTRHLISGPAGRAAAAIRRAHPPRATRRAADGPDGPPSARRRAVASISRLAGARRHRPHAVGQLAGGDDASPPPIAPLPGRGQCGSSYGRHRHATGREHRGRTLRNVPAESGQHAHGPRPSGRTRRPNHTSTSDPEDGSTGLRQAGEHHARNAGKTDSILSARCGPAIAATDQRTS